MIRGEEGLALDRVDRRFLQRAGDEVGAVPQFVHDRAFRQRVERLAAHVRVDDEVAPPVHGHLARADCQPQALDRPGFSLRGGVRTPVEVVRMHHGEHVGALA